MGKVEVAVRPARLQDYQAVMAIPDEPIFEGFDYLPARYQVYLQDKDCYCYVAEYQDRIVAFAVYHVLDNGTSLLGEGGRVVRQLQGRGILAQISQYALPRIIQDRPTLAQVVHAAFDTPSLTRPLKMIRESTAPERIALKTHILAYKDDVSVMASRIAAVPAVMKYGDVASRLATVDDMRRLLHTTSNIVNIFPSGYFLAGHNGTSFRAWPHNILLATQLYTTFISEPAPSKLSAISFGFVNQVVFGARYDAYYYGESDISTLTSHMVQHLRRALAVAKDDQKLGILFHFPQSCDVKAVKAALKPYLGSNLQTPTFKQEGGYLFEGPLPPFAKLIKSKI